MKRYSTIILRLAIIIAGIVMVAIQGGITWWVADAWASNPNHHIIMTVLLAGLYTTAFPFFIALNKTMKLLDYIDSNRAFSELSVRALKTIMYCAIAVFISSSASGLPFFYYWAELDDAPGLVVIGMAISGAAFLIAIFASVLKRLLQDAIDVKSENDLTI